MVWYCYLRNIQDLLSDGKTPYEMRFGMPCNGPVNTVWSSGRIITLFLRKTNLDCISLEQKSCQAYFSIIDEFPLLFVPFQQFHVDLCIFVISDCNSLQHVVQQYLWSVSPRCISMKFVLPKLWLVGLPCVWAFAHHHSRSTGAATVSLSKCICCLVRASNPFVRIGAIRVRQTKRSDHFEMLLCSIQLLVRTVITSILA